ncbi:MAG: RIP metalloprotease RseP [Clostridiales bacterium]|nr:RIP metalloprotease RseP [Clostridiales bacterium]
MINIVTTILITVLVFGALILIHEFGHYLFARLFKVSILEFAIGMGPKVFSKKSKKTGIAYSLRALPIGGFVSMVGENGDSEDEGALHKKPKWQRAIVLAAGACMNLLLGFVILVIYVSLSPALGSTVVAEFSEEASSYQAGLQTGDEIISVDGHRVHVLYDLSYAIARHGTEPISLTVVRNGKKIVLENVSFPSYTEMGVVFGEQDFKVTRIEKNPVSVLYYAYHHGVTTVRMVWESIIDMITGRYGLEAMSGPVGVSSAIGDAASSGMDSFLILIALITINLGIFNLLPFPALDGGQLLFLLIEAIRKKPMKPEIEGLINAAGLGLLMLLMIVVTVKDVIGFM